jgi:hypothetical protein
MSDILPDSDESQLWRPPSPAPYSPVTRKLTVSKGVLDLTLRVFAPYAQRCLEACCFWYGTEDALGNGHVVAAAVPRQANHWGCYNVAGGAMAAISRVVREKKWLNLSQVHIHPGRAVEHSRYDDAHANSRNALSVVFPHYGRWTANWPVGVGVHEYQNNYWHLLSDDQAYARVIIDHGDATAFLIDGRANL